MPLVVSHLLPFALYQNQAITTWTCSLPQATEILSYRTSRKPFFPPLCRAARNEGTVGCFRPRATAELRRGPLLRRCVLRGNGNSSGTRTFLGRWESSGHCGVEERFSCWNYWKISSSISSFLVCKHGKWHFCGSSGLHEDRQTRWLRSVRLVRR